MPVTSSRLVQAVFALLVVATVGAFAVTQTLKTEVPVVLRFAVSPADISPNGDGVRDSSLVGFDLSAPATITFSVIDRDGNEVRRLVDGRRLAGDAKHRFRFDGRDDSGKPLPDGVYRLRVQRRSEGRSLDSYKTLRIDTRPPRVRLATALPGVVDPGAGRGFPVRIRYRGPRNRFPEFRVWRTDGGPVRIVRRFRGAGRGGVWDGRVIGGRIAVDGNYAFQVRVRDKAGNGALWPPSPPSPRTATAGTGVAVRRLTLSGPLTIVAAGGLARLTVGPSPRRFSFALSRLGSQRSLRRDTRRGGVLRVRIPRRSRTGIYLVRVRARGRRALWPLVVAGLPPRRALRRPRPLVVVPAITWQGRNAYDSDLDGFGDTLANSPSIPASRPFLGGRLPAGLRSEVSPLLRFLDRRKLAYDLTTDLSLARREGPVLSNAPGVAIAGSAEWLPRLVRDRLLSGVRDRGQTVVIFGRESLRRSVAPVGDRLRDPSPPRPDDLFGERTSVERADLRSPLRARSDRLRLFAGVDTLFGDFTLFERSDRLPRGAVLEASAVRDSDRPDFVAYRLGRGLVVRVGTPQWATQLEDRALATDVPRITRNLWARLSR